MNAKTIMTHSHINYTILEKYKKEQLKVTYVHKAITVQNRLTL